MKIECCSKMGLSWSVFLISRHSFGGVALLPYSSIPIVMSVYAPLPLFLPRLWSSWATTWNNLCSFRTDICLYGYDMLTDAFYDAFHNLFLLLLLLLVMCRVIMPLPFGFLVCSIYSLHLVVPSPSPIFFGKREEWKWGGQNDALKY